jgi:hypothetical protein
VDIRKVQDILAGEQNVPLPRNIHTDPSYTELAEEKQYGLYTAAAKLAKETGDALAHRQDGQRERKAELEAQQAQH